MRRASQQMRGGGGMATNMSGYELPFDAQYWIDLPNTEKLNCYDYAFGNANPAQQEYSQPIARTSDTHVYTCESVEAGMLKQHPEVYVAEFEQPCKAGERKIGLFVDDVHPSDYHFWRQDDDGYWSHKPGYQNPRREDARGKLIKAPHESSREFEHFNYTHQCNYYCIPASANFGK